MPDRPMVHIVDDDEAVRDSLAILLEASGFRVAVYESAVKFLETAVVPTTGCLIADVRMPGMDGLELQERLRARQVRLPVLIMTGHADVPMAVRAMKAGAIDFIEKPFSEEALLESVRQAVASSSRPRRDDGRAADILDRLAALTAREREVLDALVEGRPNKVIAYELGISPRTVEVHRARVMEKMQARSLSELVRMALSAGVTGETG